MKLNLLFILMLILAVSFNNVYSQGVSINDDGTDPAASAILDLQSSDKGLLVPRMAYNHITNIQNPANGLIVFNTTDNKYYAFLEGDNAWKEIAYGTSIIEPFECGNNLYDFRDGQSYPTKQYGSQCWMLKNLNIGTMQGGSTQTDDGNIEKYCYQNNTSYCDDYGGLYQWNEAMQYTTTEGTQGICPDGWHIPSNIEWFTFENLIDPTITNPNSTGPQGTIGSGGLFKEAGYAHWSSPNYNATNASGFTALGSGNRYGMSSNYLKMEADFWTSTQYNSIQAYDRELYYNGPNLYRQIPNKFYGLGVRCVKDQ